MLLAAYRLAFHFNRPVSELRISMREFLTWLAYLDIEPPERAADVRNASLQATIMNMSGRSLRDKKYVTPSELLGEAEPEQPQSVEQQKAMLKSIARSKPDGR